MPQRVVVVSRPKIKLEYEDFKVLQQVGIDLDGDVSSEEAQVFKKIDDIIELMDAARSRRTQSGHENGIPAGPAASKSKAATA